MKFYRGIACSALIGMALSAGAAVLKTDPANSGVSVTFKQMNVPVEAPFTRFSAAIEYDPAQPGAGRASVDIDTASLELGDPDINREVAKKEWFDAVRFPKATFVSSAIKPAGAGRLQVNGKLTIKGQISTVSFPLTVSSAGGKQVFEGTLPIRRLAYRIGEGDWSDTSIVADEVVIKFRFTTVN